MREAIEEVMTIQRDKAESRKISMDLQLVGFGASVMIVTDKMRLQQLVLSYQSNALKFTPEGGHITIKAEIEQRQADEFLIVRVKDNGCGISEQNQQKLFKMFGFLDETSELNTQGIGLGLYITKMVVGAFDGEVSVNSKVGEGSEFSLALKLSNADPLIGEEIRDVNPQLPWGGEKLVVYISDNSREILPLNLTKRIGVIASPSTFNENQKIQLALQNEESFYSSSTVREFELTELQNDIQVQRRVLIVDDEPFNLMSLKTILKSALKIIKVNPDLLKDLIDEANDGN